MNRPHTLRLSALLLAGERPGGGGRPDLRGGVRGVPGDPHAGHLGGAGLAGGDLLPHPAGHLR